MIPMSSLKYEDKQLNPLISAPLEIKIDAKPVY